MRLNALLRLSLPCLLLGMLAAPTFAVNVSLSPGSDVIDAIANANAGDVVQFSEGTYNISSPITVPTGVTITSTDGYPDNTHINFNLTGTNTTSYGFVIAGGATNVTISELDIVSNHGIVQLAAASATGYSNITITNNNLEYGGGQLSDGTLVMGINETVQDNNLEITHNYFHDSPNTARNWCIWYASNSQLDYNEFYNINDGGQIDNPGPNVEFNYNYGTYIHRMGQEVALVSTSVFTCDNNVFYDYVSPYNDTEGVSIIGVSAAVYIENNYFKADIAPGSSWGQPDASGVNRFGYAIEATGNPGTVSGNTLIGKWAEDVSSDIANLLVEGNTVYGTALWGAFDGEPGPFGYGSILLNSSDPNSVDNNVNDAPSPPANTFNAGIDNSGSTTTGGSTGTGTTVGDSGGSTGGSSGGSTGGGSTGGGSTGNTGTPVTTTQDASNNAPLPLTGVKVQVTSSSTCTVTWTSPNPNIVSVTINIISTVGRQNFPGDTQTGDLTSMSIPDMHAGWLIDFTVVATGSNGQKYVSKPVTASFPGNSLAPWSGLLWGGISVLKTNPYIH